MRLKRTELDKEIFVLSNKNKKAYTANKNILVFSLTIQMTHLF